MTKPKLVIRNTLYHRRSKEELEIPLKQRILELIFHRRTVTFAELKSCFGDEFNGEHAFGKIDQNIFFWTNMSKKFIDILVSLLEEEYIKTELTTSMVYMMDGSVLLFPIVKRANHKYKKPRWLPVIFNPTEKCQEIEQVAP